ncbi:MAG: circadian clock KaiB family protein [Bacteroidota bacterium]
MKSNRKNDIIENKFILFVSGMSVKSITAIENITKICNTHLFGNFELEIIDVNKEKHQAAQHQIIGLPTLIKTGPGPIRTILGDLSETDKVLKILNIRQ